MVQVRAAVVARVVDKVEAVAKVVVGAQDKVRAVVVVKASVKVWGVAGKALALVANVFAQTAARLFHTSKVCLVLR